jgi:UDP-glucose 4-epimerase
MVNLVTGGAGFIGSHLVDFLMERGEAVHVLDNLSSGDLSNIDRWVKHPDFGFYNGDLRNAGDILPALEGCETVYHLAANPEVRSSKASPQDHFDQNILATFNLLEAIRLSGEVESLIFASTSTVYGEPSVIPTPESYGPMKPISHYGASKLACEALISSYASMYGFRCILFRLANVIGGRSNHGVIYDFVQKLRVDPSQLEVLGDGSQSKSYLFIDDCVSGIVFEAGDSSDQICVFNLGSDDRVDVLSIADIVIEEMGLEHVEVVLTGGVDGGRGWKGDVKLMQLDTAKLSGMGWIMEYGSSEAVRLTASEICRR